MKCQNLKAIRHLSNDKTNGQQLYEGNWVTSQQGIQINQKSLQSSITAELLKRQKVTSVDEVIERGF